MENTLKYKKEIDEVFSFLYEDWMDEIDKEDFKKILLKKMNKTYSDLDQDIQIGIDNGYSVENQIALIKKIFKSIKYLEQ